jgi:methionyl-tRNA formyltransferase
MAHVDNAWIKREVWRLRERYPSKLDGVPILTAADPGEEKVQRFLSQLQPDIMIARCKFILKRNLLGLPRCGTFIMHPGICPEYRNAHGCFWALANRDLARVGMTLLKADAGVDTGPMFLHASYAFDEMRESHVVIQYRAVTENLDAIARTLAAVCDGSARPLPAEGRRSATWGQPWLTAYLKWKSAARRLQSSAADSASLEPKG